MGKTTCFLLATALLFAGCRTATEPLTGQWQPVAQLPGDVYYSEILFINQQAGWVVGDSGRILRTADAGQDWEVVQSGSKEDFHSVAFVSDQVGWVGGRRNTILHTTDGGNSWSIQNISSDSLHRIMSMSFIDGRQGWVGSNYGEIFHTTDGGTSWFAQQSDVQWGLNAVCFVNATHGWASTGGQTIVKTTDGGAHWETIDYSGMQSAGWCTDMAFIDEQRGWIATTVSLSSSIQSGAPVLYTEDGGTTWTKQAVLPTSDLLSVSATLPASAWVAGFDQIFHTPDGGTTWSTQYRDDDKVFVSLSFVDTFHGWALDFRGSVLRYEL